MAETARPVVQVQQGLLRGIIETSVYGQQYKSFKGIPYGKPPVGKLRFQDPLPVESWTGIRDASDFGQACAQVDSITNTTDGGDDCLYLNVYTTAELGSSLRSEKAVMVWIHGGAFFQGSGNDLIYGPDYIIDKDVILVTLNYRLHVLGFLDLEDEIHPGNQGLKDQVLALKWVQNNIAQFGGNPKNVTIFGESAGSASVHYLILSSTAKGLFHKAIAQSGTALNPWASMKTPKLWAKQLAAALGKELEDSKEILNFLGTVDAQTLAVASMKLPNKPIPGLLAFVPTVDAKSKNPFLPVSVRDAANKGVDVPLLLGAVEEEGILFLPGYDDKKRELFNKRFEDALSPAIMDLLEIKNLTPADIRKFYFDDKPLSKENISNYVQMQSDLQFLSGIHDVLEIQVSKKQHPTYVYKFAYDSGKSLVKNKFGIDMPGVCHADDLAYIFYPRILSQLGIGKPPDPGSTEHLVIQRVTQMWTNFAKTGNPTPGITETIPVIWTPLKYGENFECLTISEDLKMETMANINKRLVEISKSKL